MTKPRHQEMAERLWRAQSARRVSWAEESPDTRRLYLFMADKALALIEEWETKKVQEAIANRKQSR